MCKYPLYRNLFRAFLLTALTLLKHAGNVSVMPVLKGAFPLKHRRSGALRQTQGDRNAAPGIFMPMKTLFLLPILLLSLTARADKVLVASCSEGKGCTFSLSDVETDMAQSFGGEYENLKPESVLVFGQKKDGSEITYVENHKTRTQIDRQWGGDGYTQIYLFDPFIQPADGAWEVQYGAPSGNECYGIGNVGAYIGKFIQRGTAGTGAINFRKPFSPAQLFPSAQMKWRQTGYSRYAGVIDFGSNELAGFKLYYTIHVVSRKKIETVYTMTMKIPTKGQCQGVIPVTFTLSKETNEGHDFTDDDDLLPVSSKRKSADHRKSGTETDRLNEADDDLLPVKSKEQKDNLLPVKSRGNGDDLKEVRSRDELLPVKPGQKPKPKVDRLNDADDDLLPVKSKGQKDDLLPVKAGQPTRNEKTKNR